MSEPEGPAEETDPSPRPRKVYKHAMGVVAYLKFRGQGMVTGTGLLLSREHWTAAETAVDAMILPPHELLGTQDDIRAIKETLVKGMIYSGPGKFTRVPAVKTLYDATPDEDKARVLVQILRRDDYVQAVNVITATISFAIEESKKDPAYFDQIVRWEEWGFESREATLHLIRDIVAVENSAHFKDFTARPRASLVTINEALADPAQRDSEIRANMQIERTRIEAQLNLMSNAVVQTLTFQYLHRDEPERSYQLDKLGINPALPRFTADSIDDIIETLGRDALFQMMVEDLGAMNAPSAYMLRKK